MRRMTLGATEPMYRDCVALASAHYENFPTAAWWLPREVRQAVAAVYAFARQADDIADESTLPAEERKRMLDAWEVLLRRSAAEELPHPVFAPLGEAIRRFRLDVEELARLLVAFRMDLDTHAYASERELMFYCRHSAAPIGRTLLSIAGIEDPRLVAASDALCAGLQLVNFWQDIAEDLARGRCYLPASWLEPHGITPEALIRGGAKSEKLAVVWPQAFAYAAARLDEGRLLLSARPRWLRMLAAGAIAGGFRVLGKLKRRTDLKDRARLRARDRLAVGWAVAKAAWR